MFSYKQLAFVQTLSFTAVVEYIQSIARLLAHHDYVLSNCDVIFAIQPSSLFQIV